VKKLPDGMVILRSIVWYPNWGSHKEPHYLPLKRPKIGEPKNIHALSWSTIVICNKKVGARGMHSEIQISCRKIKNRRLPFTGNA